MTNNHLQGETSPYLLQHAHNPVDWYPWNAAAFAKARQEDKPIFLSIGYSTCHWCHVMERESFEDEQVAKILNRDYVAIKVDREERPDIDQAYMTVCQVMTGQGGWPLSILMTAERQAFWAGTYLKRSTRSGGLGLMELLARVSELWIHERPRLLESGQSITDALRSIRPNSHSVSDSVESHDALLRVGYDQLTQQFDPQWAGFGNAPKFPSPHQLAFLLRWHYQHPSSAALSMVEQTISAWRSGGIYDQIGFGIHRYSVDRHWRTPHFEKMLYDQALVLQIYLESWQVTGKQHYAQVAQEIIAYLQRELLSPEGGFYAAEDADSEGEEGLFYTWTPSEITKILGEKAQSFCEAYGIETEQADETGRCIPYLSKRSNMGLPAPDLETIRLQLLDLRNQRPHPFKDTKIVCAWNGLLIAALSRAAICLNQGDYLVLVRNAADFILDQTRHNGGRLFRYWRDGTRVGTAFADDYAALIWALLELYQASFVTSYLAAALQFQAEMETEFWDADQGAFNLSSHDQEAMIFQPLDASDGAVPSANSMAALNLVRLSRLTGNPEFEQQATIILETFSAEVARQASAYTHLLLALDYLKTPGQEIVIAGDIESSIGTQMLQAIRRTWNPYQVILVKRPGSDGQLMAELAPFTAAMTVNPTGPLVYVCEGFRCHQAVGDLASLEQLLVGPPAIP